jgi:hypothetical protein
VLLDYLIKARVVYLDKLGKVVHVRYDVLENLLESYELLFAGPVVSSASFIHRMYDILDTPLADLNTS